MITLLSPSKGQNFTAPVGNIPATTPLFLNRAQELISHLQKYSSPELQKLMSISTKIADLNVSRYQHFTTPFTTSNSKQALFSFIGDVYGQMDVATYSLNVLEFSQNHLRILSGLYGVLRPLDLIQAYRLEMKTKLTTATTKNLYGFWGEELQLHLKRELQSHPNPKIINLASKEYFKAIKPKKNLDILTINFKEVKNGKTRIIAIFAKRARGLLANYIMQHTIDDHQELTAFTGAGYRFSKNDSDQSQFTFTRPQPQGK